MSATEPDPTAVVAVIMATGLSLERARKFVLSSPPELIQRIGEAHRAWIQSTIRSWRDKGYPAPPPPAQTPVGGNATVMALRGATGLPVLEARELVRYCPPAMIQPLLDAAEHHAWMRSTGTQHSPCEWLRDPVEENPATGPVVRRVLEETRCGMLALHGQQRGLCHIIWNEAEQRLEREHGILWHSPRRMCPHIIFD